MNESQDTPLSEGSWQPFLTVNACGRDWTLERAADMEALWELSLIHIFTSLALSGKEEKASRFYSPGGFLFEREVNEAERFRRFLRYGVLL